MTKIEWTDATRRAVKTAAKRAGVTATEYASLRLSGLKFCWRCRVWREVASFGLDRSRADGLSSICVGCRRRPKQLLLIRETRSDYERRRYATDATYRLDRKRRSYKRKRGVDAVPPEAVEALTERFGGKCAYCTAAATTWDHLLPVSKGGMTVPGNIVPACLPCNSSKRDDDVEDFIVRRGLGISETLDSFLALAYSWGQL